jgi:hypothetical protein
VGLGRDEKGAGRPFPPSAFLVLFNVNEKTRDHRNQQADNMPGDMLTDATCKNPGKSRVKARQTTGQSIRRARHPGRYHGRSSGLFAASVCV